MSKQFWEDETVCRESRAYDQGYDDGMRDQKHLSDVTRREQVEAPDYAVFGREWRQGEKMSELKLTDVELTGEYREPNSDDLYLRDGKVTNEPDSWDRHIVRIIPHDGFWAAKQALAGQKMHKGSWHNKCEYLIADGYAFYLFTKGQRIMWELSPVELLATDWRIYEEPKIETPVADHARERMKTDGWAPTSSTVICDAIDRIERRIEKLEQRIRRLENTNEETKTANSELGQDMEQP